MRKGTGVVLSLVAVTAVYVMVQARGSEPHDGKLETFDEVHGIPIGAETTPGDLDALYIIARPGTYHLTADMTGVPGKCGIEVAADDVTIDLGGFALIGVPESLEGIRVRPTHLNFRVVDGTIRDWGGIGVDAREAGSSQLVNLHALWNGGMGFAVRDGGTIIGSSSMGNVDEPLTVFPPLRCRDGSCPGGPTTFSYLLALPISGPITDQTSLFQSIPHAVSVSKLNPLTDTYWTWNGVSCSGGPEPACGATCFCVRPGEAFKVTASAPSSYTVLGNDGSTTLALQGPGAGSLTGANLVSLPYCSSVTTASQLINSIGLASVTNIQKYLCATDSFQVYTGRMGSPGPDFALVPGEGYVVKMGTNVNYATQYSATCTTSACGCAVPPSGMVAWWRFDETSGTTASDTVGMNNGTISGATRISGEVDGALQFDGVNDEIAVPDNPSLDFGTGDLSFDAWVRTTSGSGVRVILDKRDASNTGYHVYVNSGTLGFQLSGTNYGSGATAINTGQWVHVAITVDRDQATGGKFYVNGVNIATFNPTGQSASLDNAFPLYLGRHRDGGSILPGDLDEVELFNRVLTPAEVLSIYNAGSNGKCKDASRFCNTTSTTILDGIAASPYPSTIAVSGITGTAACVTVNLNGFTQTFPDDVDMLLVSTGAQNAIIMSDVGGSNAVSGVNLTLDDSAASALPDSTVLTSGVFRPANFEVGDVFPAGAPTPLGGSALSVFSGTTANGTWSLYVADDAGGDTGSLASWCVNIRTCDCDDGNPCTTDACDCATGQCFFTPNANACDDGLFCNGADTCSGGACSTHVGNPCPGADGDGNCAESCNEAGDNCTAADPNGSACTDSLFCNGADTCNGGACSTHVGDPCPGADGDGNCAESCNEASDNCTAADPNGSACTDSLFCNGADTCNAGACSTHVGNPCPGADGDANCAESCNEAGDNCTAADPNGSACTDSLFCNGADTCNGGACSTHVGDPCPGADGDGNCAESCNEAGDNCTAADPNGSACTDSLFCNGADTCNGGACSTHVGNPCPGADGDANCAESCNEAGDNCTAADPNGSACTDSLFCNGADTCNGGACSTHVGDPCPGADGDANCAESCNEAGDNCTAADPNGSACTDSLFCNGADTCSAGACSTHVGNPCPGADGDANCAESCNEAGDNCTAADPNGSACTDSLFCNGADTCSAGACSTHVGNPCPGADGDGNCAESCNEAGDNCTAADPNGSACTDSLFCNGADTCNGGACSTHVGDPCPGADGDANCAESCNEAGDNCTAADPNGSACTDSLFCNGADTCNAGACSTHVGNPCPGADGDGNCAESCNEAGDNCTAADPNGSACNDGNVCTSPDTCHDGACGCAPTVTNYMNMTPVTIPTTVAVVSSSITAGPVGPFLSRVRVTTNIRHSNNAHLDVTLTSPSGTVVTITSDNGSTNDNVFNGTLWDDKANPGSQVPYTSNNGIVTDALTAFNVVLTPAVVEEALAAFYGQNPNGVWILRVSDDTAGEGGTLDGWVLELTTLPAVPVSSTSTFLNSTPTALADSPEVSTSSLVVSGAGAAIGRVRVTTSLRHTFPGDLDVTLRSPAGTVVTLATDDGDANDNVFNGTLWDDTADPGNQVPFAADTFAASRLASDTVYANNVPKSTLIPEEALGAFQGENPNGTWVITVSDDGSGDTGTLDQWSLEVTTVVGTCGLVCNDNNPCTDDLCDPLTGCVFPPNDGNTCNDNNPCTVDHCVNGVCACPLTQPCTALPRTYSSTDVPKTIPFEGPPVVTSMLTVAGAAPYLMDADVRICLPHSFSADLDITIKSPSGTIVTLTTDNGESYDNVFNCTTFDDHANPGGQVPYATNNGVVTDHVYANSVAASPLTPEEALGAFVGENPNGVWLLTVADDGFYFGGSLDAWSVILSALPAAPTQTTYHFATAATVPIPAASVTTSTIAVAGAGSRLGTARVTTNIRYPRNEDLDVTLTSPTGKVVTLTTDNGGTVADSFNGTLWSDKADPGGQVPYTSNDGLVTDRAYVDHVTATPQVPEEALAALGNDNPNGTWTLRISNDSSNGSGALEGWSLDLVTIVCPPPCDITCDDGNPCTTDSCNPAVGCVFAYNTADCSDGDACTGGDRCSNGACVGAVTSCADGNVCTDDACDPATGLCVHTNNTVTCDDGDACTFNDRCVNGLCTCGNAICVDTASLYSNSSPAGIHDLTVLRSTIVVVGAGTYLTDLDLTTWIGHTFPEDLDVTLKSPSGTIVTVTSDNGGEMDDVFYGTRWNDQADPDNQLRFPDDAFEASKLVTNTIYTEGVAKATLVPEEGLSAFNGQNPNGVWTLAIYDDSDQDSGLLEAWRLDLKTLAQAPTETTRLSANTTPQTIPAIGTPLVTSTIAVSGSGARLGRLRLNTDLTHTANDNLDITLTSPHGTVATITADNGGTFDNVFHGTLWDDRADPGNDVPFPGTRNTFLASNIATDTVYANNTVRTTLVAQESLGAFNGENPNGVWTLRVADDTGGPTCVGGSNDGLGCTGDAQCPGGTCTGDGGSLHSWSLEITTIACGTCLQTCDDANACTADACIQGQCVHTPVPNGTVCDDGNACTFGDACLQGVCTGAPRAINDSLRVGRSGTAAVMTWSDAPGPYNVYVGTRAAGAPWAYNQTCFASNVAGTTVTHVPVPAARASFHYLISRRSSCGESILGSSSNGAPIPNNSPCP